MPDRPLVLGHRGASHARPENTLSAFAMARELGADGVELDARRSADGWIVVHHNPGVEGFGLIVEHGFTALRAAHPEIPTLVEALQACAGMIVNVEIKCLPWEPDADTDRVVVRAVGEIVRAAVRAGPPGSEFIVSSFDLGAVDASLAFAPEITTGWLTSGQEIATAAPIATAHGHAWLNPDRVSALRASPEAIADARRSGLRLNVWTVDDPKEIATLAAVGVDAIITDVPDVAFDALERLRADDNANSKERRQS
ncbi:MAG: glycerophosphoryl diester phosphodiesterase [Actinomycetota bacterium]|jgi:glycerophosphoryl diester phosphodiesterase|nr:glycerophosphoryl diester phosphodiesterase [Actinomycetota bacterium]